MKQVIHLSRGFKLMLLLSAGILSSLMGWAQTAVVSKLMLPCGAEVLQVTFAEPGPNGGGTATAAKRTIYSFVPDNAGGVTTYTGTVWPYVIIAGVFDVDAGISATVTVNPNGVLLVDGWPAYQYVGDANSTDANGNYGVWYYFLPDGTPSLDACAEIYDCPALLANIGDPCDDGDPTTDDDTVNASCVCAGTPVVACPQQTLNVDITPDANGEETTWILTNANGSDILASGGPYPTAVAGVVIHEQVCVPVGCFRFTMNDAGGDGIANGGYLLSDGQGNRLIDADGAFTSVSSIGAKFCLPASTVALDPSSCDVTNLSAGDFLMAEPVAGADGYQFWVFKPHGGFSHALTQPSNTLGPLPNIPSLAGIRLNVRVRAHGNGQWSKYGPACTIQFAGNPGMQERSIANEWGDLNNAELRLWPNPNNGDRLHLTLDGIDTELDQVQVELYDAMGRRVLATTVPVADGNLNTVLEMGTATNGVYLLQVIAGDNAYTKRLVMAK